MKSLPNPEYNPNLVWYASYGSNLNYDRFLCYVKGGTPSGTEEYQEGMSDTTLPRMESHFSIPHTLYFAMDAKRWQGGVAFISELPSPHSVSYSRIYLIRRSQFVELVAKENKVPPETVSIDFEELEQKKRLKVCDSWYGLVLRVGEFSGIPVYTFTKETSDDAPRNSPSEAYLKTIITGLIACWSHESRKVLVDYLHEATKKTIPKEEITNKFNLYEEEYVKKERTTENHFRVEPTQIRTGNKREFIVQLSGTNCDRLQAKHFTPLLLSASHRGENRTIAAWLNTADDSVDEHVVRLDQKLRHALGAKIGDWITVEDIDKETRKKIKKNFNTFWEKVIRTQPELMRVYWADFEDMEIPVARIPESTFAVLGIEPGNFISIQSTTGKTRIRALPLDQDKWEKRLALLQTNQYKNSNPRKSLSLDRVMGADSGNDLPPIFIDLETRKKIGNVIAGDCVRVVRDVRDVYLSKLHLTALPGLFAAIGVALSFDFKNVDQFLSFGNLVKGAIILLGIIFTLYVLLVDVKRKIS